MLDSCVRFMHSFLKRKFVSGSPFIDALWINVHRLYCPHNIYLKNISQGNLHWYILSVGPLCCPAGARQPVSSSAWASLGRLLGMVLPGVLSDAEDHFSGCVLGSGGIRWSYSLAKSNERHMYGCTASLTFAYYSRYYFARYTVYE